LCRCEDEDGRIVRSSQISKQTRQLGLIVSNIGQALLNERQWSIPWKNSEKCFELGLKTDLRPTTMRTGSRIISIAVFSTAAGRVALNTAFWILG